MNQQKYRKKIIFWLRFTGWLCLLPASVYLYLYQSMNGNSLFLLALIVIIFFAVYLLTTAPSIRWTKPANLMGLLIFTIFFAPLILMIPIYFAYRNARKLRG